MSKRTNKLLTYALVFIALLLLFLLVYQPEAPPKAETQPRLQEAPELVAKVVYHLNRSSTLLQASLVRGAERLEGQEEVLAIRDALLNLSNSRELSEGSFPRELREALRSYATLADAAYNMYLASSVLDEVRGNVSRVLRLVLECKAYEALAEWVKIEEKVDTALKYVLQAVTDLSEVNTSALLSPNHAELVDEAAARASSVAETLGEVRKLMNIVSKYGSLLDELCRSTRRGCKCGLSSEALSAIMREVSALEPSRAGPYSYEISRVKALVARAMQRGVEGGKGIGGGEGAGYGEPPSDD